MKRLHTAQQILERWPAEAATQLIARGLDADQARVRAESARLVGQLHVRRRVDGLSRCEGRLIELGRDSMQPGRVRKAAVWSLGWIGSPEAFTAIVSIAHHDNPMYRRAAVEAAGRLGGERAAAVLREGLGDSAWQVRMDAAIGLGGLPVAVGEGNLEALLHVLANEPHPQTKEQMVRSLPEVAVGLSPSHHARTLAVLMEHLDARRPGCVRRAAARGVGELGRHLEARNALLEELRRYEGDASAEVQEELRWSTMVLRGGR